MIEFPQGRSEIGPQGRVSIGQEPSVADSGSRENVAADARGELANGGILASHDPQILPGLQEESVDFRWLGRCLDEQRGSFIALSAPQDPR
jgi:hypothetical protein